MEFQVLFVSAENKKRRWIKCTKRNKGVASDNKSRELLFSLTQATSDWTTDTSYHVHCSPIAICSSPSWICHQSKYQHVIYRHASKISVTNDLRACTARPDDYFDLCIRNVRPANWRVLLKWSSIHCRCAGISADTLRTFVSFVQHRHQSPRLWLVLLMVGDVITKRMRKKGNKYPIEKSQWMF